MDNVESKDAALVEIRVKLIALALVDGGIAVLLTNGNGGVCSLPGDGLQTGEALDDAAQRILQAQAGIDQIYAEQLYTFEDVIRAPGPRVVTIAYLALLAGDSLARSLRSGKGLTVADVVVPWADETGGPVQVHDPEQCPLELADGDDHVLGQAMLRLRGKLDYSAVGFALLPERFTLRQLQDVHEAILGVRLNKPAFRRRMLDKGWLQATGEREAGTSFRPAELYLYRPTKGA
ncbi:NUDIX hydrolase [Sphingosinicellaceae bacterium]|nr:NUDIX hydrolase [Sphingosinicellaceae bacterium]